MRLASARALPRLGAQLGTMIEESTSVVDDDLTDFGVEHFSSRVAYLVHRPLRSLNVRMRRSFGALERRTTMSGSRVRQQDFNLHTWFAAIPMTDDIYLGLQAQNLARVEMSVIRRWENEVLDEQEIDPGN